MFIYLAFETVTEAQFLLHANQEIFAMNNLKVSKTISFMKMDDGRTTKTIL